MINKPQTPTASKFTLLRQLCNYIPAHLVPKLARETGVDRQTRTFDAWSQVVALLYAQLTHAIGLNDVCDALQLHSGPLSALRAATPPSRNNFSHANRTRSPELAEKLFWSVLEHLGELSPKFVSGQAGQRRVRKFKRTIHVVDSTTIQLLATHLDWAKHRRRKAAAKAHLRLDLQSFLPRCVIIGSAQESDAKQARAVCQAIQAGEIVIFDRAYVDFEHLWELEERGVAWVTRAKENLCLKVEESRAVAPGGKLIADELVALENAGSQARHPGLLRRVAAWVEVDGQERPMTFLTNQLTWSPLSIAELYRARWRIEVFFKQMKQTLQLSDFLGSNAHAVKWQIWTALLAYVLLRYLAFLADWAHSFSRLFALVRTGLWRKWDLLKLLARYGTANGHYRYLGRPEQVYFPGFA